MFQNYVGYIWLLDSQRILFHNSEWQDMLHHER